MKTVRDFIWQDGKIKKTVGIGIFSVAMLIMAIVIVMFHNPLADPKQEIIKKVIALALIAIAEVVFITLYDKITILPVELYQSRHLIWKLAKNDFKKRYAGSYLGALWAMVQPVVTVLMYYVVFDVIMNSSDQLANAKRIVELGIGKKIRSFPSSSKQMYKVAKEIVSDNQIKEKYDIFSKQMNNDSFDEIVNEIEKILVGSVLQGDHTYEKQTS